MEGAAQSAAEVWIPDFAASGLTDVFTPAMCQRIITIAEGAGFQRSLLYGKNAEPTDDPEVRGSDTASISALHHREYYAVVADIVRRYNYEHCRFSISGLDALQVIRYRPGARFRLHSDIGHGGAANRKISLILLLSDENSYEGGELVFGNEVMPRTQGSGIIFPAWLPHEVRAVTSGVRYSLVTWAVGNFFR